jgi:glycosyltransferase EpsH
MNGFDQSQGQYLLFFDADDTIIPDSLLIIKRAIEKYDTDIIMFNAIHEEGEEREQFWPHYFEKETVLRGEDFRQKFYQDAIYTNRLNNTWTKCFRRKVIEEATRYENVSFIRVEEDYLMQLPWFDKCKSMVYLPINLYCYRVNPGSITQRNLHKFVPSLPLNAFLLYRERISYGKKWGVSNYNIISAQRLMTDMSSAIRQLRGEKNLTRTEKINYLKDIAKNQCFREGYEIGEYQNIGVVMTIVFWFLYHHLYELSLFVVEYAPQRHRIKK